MGVLSVTCAVLLILSSAHGAAPSYTLIMTADSGNYSGISEAKYLLGHMTNTRRLGSEVRPCEEGYAGSLYDKNVVLIVTGIGSVTAALCAGSITRLDFNFQEIFYLGTSGWSPMPGGVADPRDSCQQKDEKKLTKEDFTLIGDVCVSSYSANWGCGFCNWIPGIDSACHRPNCWDHDNTHIFGPCQVQGNPRVANIIASYKNFSMPERPSGLAKYLDSYWKNTTVELKPYRPPRVLGPNECAEATSDMLWQGLPNDVLCREYLLMTAPKEANPDTYTCVAAMEGFGWMRAIAANIDFRDIPITNIRGASNYVHGPMFVNDDGNWREALDWTDHDGVEDFTKKGYAYAIETASQVLLSYLNSRGSQ